MPLILGPSALLLLCWGFSLGTAVLTLTLPETFDLVPTFLRRDGRDLAIISGLALGYFWLVVALLSFLVGCLAAKTTCRTGAGFQLNIDPVRAARAVWWLNVLFLGVTVIWIAVTAMKVGGVFRLAALSMAETLFARDLLLETKLFTGMRLFYATLPVTGCLAAALLAVGLPGRSRRRCRVVLLLNTVALTVLPVVMSQRLLLLQFLLSSYIVTCLIRRRIIGLPWLMCGVLLFLSVWMMRESLTNPHFDRHPVDIGLQKLAYYFVNDLGNALIPIAEDVPHTFGAISLRGLLFFTFSDSYVAQAFQGRLQYLDGLKGGGEFPLLTAPYIDFGVIGGGLFLTMFGFTSQALFQFARAYFVPAVIYAQVAASLLFSSHALYITHQNQIFGLLVVALVARMSRPVRLIVPVIPPVSDPRRPPARFKSRRRPVARSALPEAAAKVPEPV